MTGVNSGSIWGTDIYTSDSLLAMAAVHAGKLNVGQSAVLPVTLLPGQSSYTGSTRNGVSSSSFGIFGDSYTFGSGSSVLTASGGVFLLHIPDVLLMDGITHLWVDLKYSPSSDGKIYFYIINYGVVSSP